jgi:hypothetical protein
MAFHPFHVDINLNGQQIKNFVVDRLASDPGTPGEAQMWYNDTSNKMKYQDDAGVETIATEAFVEAAVQQIGQSQGAFDASPGSLPVVGDLIDGDTAIRRGDYWDISVAGTIAGIGGADELSIGDVLKFVGTNPATPADWIGIQRNLNDTLLGNVKSERQTVNLVANTGLTVSAATIADVFSVQTYNSTGQEITVQIDKTGSANQRVLTSNQSLSGVVVEFLGATA